MDHILSCEWVHLGLGATVTIELGYPLLCLEAAYVICKAYLDFMSTLSLLHMACMRLLPLFGYIVVTGEQLTSTDILSSPKVLPAQSSTLNDLFLSRAVGLLLVV